MQNISKKWQIAPRISQVAEENLQKYPPVLRQILYNRGFDEHEAARRYLNAEPPPGTDPENMLGVPEAVERIRWAIRQGQTIAVYGDYDADGVTATALLTQALEGLGANVLGYIPNRFDEGYGLNNEALASLKAEGVDLVITVDCGIRSPKEAEFARSIDLDLIISDHHHPGSELPHAVAVINPKQKGDSYPEKDLAGVGLAYKLAAALYAKESGNGRTFTAIEDLLDLVALGTVADLAPLRGENRALVRKGLKHIRNPKRQGLMALIGVSRLQPKNISSTDIGFMLGPRLNAAGRLDSATAALNLLRTNNLLEAGRLAQVLDIQNRERQQITKEIQEKAEELALEQDPEALLLFAAHESFNSGVVGLAASRLTDRYYRPSIVAEIGEEFTRGSCRSIPEFHITEALDHCADLLDHYGGHAAAAGFTVSNRNLTEFIERLRGIAERMLIELDLRPTLKADMEIPLADLKPELLNHLDWLQPTGYGNPQAVFVSRNLKVINSRQVGKDSSHLKLVVSDLRITYDAIAFRLGHWHEQMPPAIDLMYTFEKNEFNGRTTLQLNVRDLKPSGLPD